MEALGRNFADYTTLPTTTPHQPRSLDCSSWDCEEVESQVSDAWSFIRWLPTIRCISSLLSVRSPTACRERVDLHPLHSLGLAIPHTDKSFIAFRICDFPGQIDVNDPSFRSDAIFATCKVLVFVIDSQDDSLDAVQRLHGIVAEAYKVNPSIHFEVFIHKVDGLSDDHKIETHREISQRIHDDLSDVDLPQIHITFHLTSIYDYSIYEAFSKVVQKLIGDYLPTLENLLNVFNSTSGVEKSFLFDSLSKVYVATDSTPVDMQWYELCSDMMDVVLDVASIYGSAGPDPTGPEPDEEHAEEAQSTIKLNNNMVLYLREVNRNLSLVCLLREENFASQGVIDFNFRCFREAVLDVLEVRKGRFDVADRDTVLATRATSSSPS
ncbi:hypothetical protein SeMB42_g03486 [Synchytrium endobioticum]|uniref:GTP-binding protein n=1 Tax=Synchytrium endobioticum TaxID=286115 RepID=A0A507D6U2_9FUNG|nr:hypothetical protein SeMB42_g03486 [Synchytrium endobioticum]